MRKRRISRRSFSGSLACVALPGAASWFSGRRLSFASEPESPSRPIRGAKLGPVIRYNQGSDKFIYGDTFSAAWAEDNEVYLVMDDSQGFNGPITDKRLGRNVMIGSLGITVPPNLTGRNVNTLDGFGANNQLGADGACWKGNGIACVDGILYLSASRHWYHRKDYDRRQIARDASLVKSEDKGRTWTPVPPTGEPLPKPMFPGSKFATPFFVDYGKDTKPPAVTPDQADLYVYALSNDGYWDNGNAIHLGRVRRDLLGRLAAEDWEFFAGIRSGKVIWRPGLRGLEVAVPMLLAPWRCGQTGMTYIPALGRYILPAWHYPKLDADNWNVAFSVWEFFEAPAPWGPWTSFGRWEWPELGLYNPSLPSKYVSADGRELWALAAGNFDTWGAPLEKTDYTLHLVRISLQV